MNGSIDPLEPMLADYIRQLRSIGYALDALHQKLIAVFDVTPAHLSGFLQSPASSHWRLFLDAMASPQEIQLQELAAGLNARALPSQDELEELLMAYHRTSTAAMSAFLAITSKLETRFLALFTQFPEFHRPALAASLRVHFATTAAGLAPPYAPTLSASCRLISQAWAAHGPAVFALYARGLTPSPNTQHLPLAALERWNHGLHSQSC